MTRGAQGCFIQAEEAMLLDAFATQIVDTIGAGDTHIGAIMAARYSGFSWREAGIFANRASALVLAHAGAQLNDDDIATLMTLLKQPR